MLSRDVNAPTRTLLRHLARFSALALLVAAPAGVATAIVHSGEARNYDARIAAGAEAAIQPSASQLQSIDALERQIPELAVEFEPTTGATRSLYNRVGFLTPPAHGEAMDLAMDFVTANLKALGLTEADLADYEVTDSVYSKVSGVTHIYLRQTHEGLPVYNGQLHINVSRDGQILSVNNSFVPELASAVNTTEPGISAAAAVSGFASHLGLPTTVRQGGIRGGAGTGPGQVTTLNADGLSTSPVRAQLMWLPVSAGDVRLVWNFQAETPDHQHYYDATVDAVSGRVMTRFDWTNSGTYRVYQQPVESPIHTSPLPPSDARTLAVNPEDSTASPSGWFSGGTMDGNNVHACPDASPANNSCDSNPQCSGTTCDFSINLSSAPSNSIPAATANLFYWNNIIHDVQYQYGFDEAGGNFQENNFGNGGAGSDSVNADAQDGGGNCNANFSTPTDGGNPRMQMYTCNRATPSRDGDYDNGVIVHEYGHGISIRQVGGPNNSSCLNNSQQAGEGWSDWHALVYTAKASDTGPQARGVGAYMFNYPAAGGTIRDLPYSTSNSVNNWTYSSIAGASIPHGIGSRWAQGIWEVYWALVDKWGFEGDLINFDPSDPNEAGNKRALFYINEGLKNTACSPTFINNRDGIIQAATSSFNGEDVCTIWEAFAAFGLGTNASTGGSNSTTATNGFNIPTSCDDDPPPTCENVLHSATFESGNDGWTNNAASTCSTGSFVQGTPTLVTNGGVTTQVGGAASGTGAWFTATNSSAGVNDVDGGTCDTRSPSVSAAAGQVTISFDYFHGQRDAGGDSADGFVVDVLNNGSVIGTVVNQGDITSNAAWTSASTTVNLASAGNIQLRVRATDGTASGDLVEGGIDNVLICGGDGGPPTGGCTVNDSFESGATGWFNDSASTCSTGTYVLGNPTQQVSTVITQPAGSATGSNSIFTATNSSAGADDVDGGNCILGSPTWSVANASTLSVAYFHGQRDTGNDPSGDFFRVEYSLNGGSSWNTLVSNGDTRSVASWSTATASIPAGSSVALRVQCSDGAGPGDIVECGIDDVSICDN
jgi:extracellular elastinolytic metalloproteinase